MSATGEAAVALNELEGAINAAWQQESALDPKILMTFQRGAQVSIFQIFESFLKARGEEWATTLTQARLHPSRLADNGTNLGQRMMEVGVRRSQRVDTTAERAQVIGELSSHLTSLTKPEVQFSKLLMCWTGSNVSFDDLTSSLEMLGVDDAKGALTQVWRGVNPSVPQNQGIKNLFDALALPRHQAAHADVLDVPYPVLVTLPAQSRYLCLSVDVVGTWAVNNMMKSDPEKKFRPPALRRFTESDGYWAELGPGAKRATRHQDFDAGWRIATERARRNRQTLLHFGKRGSLLGWNAG